MKKLAIISTHPIQYNAPIFKLLNERKKIEIKVFYTWGESVLFKKFDPGFKKEIKWDIPLLEGYEHTFVNNTAKNPGSHHFWGIKNPSLIHEIEFWQADCILVFGWRFYSHLKCIRYFKNKIPVYFRGDSTLLDTKDKPIINFFRHLLLKWVYKNVDKAFYVGKANKAYFKKFGLKENKLVFAPHAIDNFRFSNDFSISYKKTLGIPLDSIVILFAGKFESKKNPFLLLDAFHQIKNKNVHLLFVGNGELENEIIDRINNKNYQDQNRIHLLPFQNQSEMPSVYQSSDIFILPSSGPNETWGLSVNEAMAAGKAIIVSDKCGCHLDLIVDGLNGFVFKSNDKNSLIESMLQTIDKNKFISMGKESKRIISNWTFNTIAETFENTIINNNRQ